MIAEINIICMGDVRYRFKADKIRHYNLEYKPDILRIDFKDGSFVEFTRQNILVVEVNTAEGMKGE